MIFVLYRNANVYPMTYSAVEALTVVIVVESLDPAVTRLDGEATREALSREQLVPICNSKEHLIYLAENNKLYKINFTCE